MAKYLGFSALVLIGLATQPAAAAVNGGLIDLLSFSQINAYYDYGDAFGNPDNIPITAHEHFASSDALGTVMNDNHAYALLPDSSHGSVEFSGTSTATITAAGFNADPSATASAFGFDAFFYAFTITTPGTLSVLYSTADNGAATEVPEIDLFKLLVSPTLRTYLPINGAGSTTFNLTPGDYNFSIFSDSLSQYAVQSGAPGTTQAAADERFSFSILPAVPEPTTWLMMLVGFGAVGLSTRRRLGRNLRAA